MDKNSKMFWLKLHQFMLDRYGFFVSIFVVSWSAFLAVLGLVWPAVFNGWVIIIGGFIALEWFIRVVLYLAFGKNYYYVLFTYVLVDHEVYGNAFRKSCHVKEVPFLLFDKFIFPYKSDRPNDEMQNRLTRVDFNINSLGFRGKEFDPKSKKSKLRIFCSGGSTTACDSNSDAEAWPAQLEVNLKKHGYDVEVINAGVQGWYSYQELLRIKNEIVNYQPDVVLFHQGWNEEFEYSSLGLGEDWKPKVVRNVREENYLYCPPNKVLSSTVSLAFYLGVQSYMKRVFKKNMSFDNPKRWEVLLQDEYLSAWMENIIESVKALQPTGALVFNLDYPCLVGVDDSPFDRRVYVANSRLTANFAEYQAISKERNAFVLKSLEPLVTCLNVDEAFNEITALKRLELFGDEIHLTPKGNYLYAQKLAELLIANKDFNAKYANPAKPMTPSCNDDVINRIKDRLLENPQQLVEMVDHKIQALQYSVEPEAKAKAIEDVPHDRYTTF